VIKVIKMRAYRPILIPRRGEIIAWGLFILVGAVWLALVYSGNSVPGAFPFMAVLMLFLAAGISLGNWMDRHTLIRLSEDSIEFSSGLRRVHLNWSQLQRIYVLPSRLGDMVQVFGEGGFFQFRILGEVRVRGELRGRMGFEAGEEILREMIKLSGLKTVDKQGDGDYYARP
jgi:hypothetical protein